MDPPSCFSTWVGLLVMINLARCNAENETMHCQRQHVLRRTVYVMLGEDDHDGIVLYGSAGDGASSARQGDILKGASDHTSFGHMTSTCPFPELRLIGIRSSLFLSMSSAPCRGKSASSTLSHSVALRNCEAREM